MCGGVVEFSSVAEAWQGSSLGRLSKRPLHEAAVTPGLSETLDGRV